MQNYKTFLLFIFFKNLHFLIFSLIPFQFSLLSRLSLSMSTFADLKVHELRSELAVRGIDTTGIKSALIRRLSDFEAENPATQRKKRRREPKDDDATALENLRKMGVRELREAAVARGVSSDGTKKEILERIAVVIQETGSMGDGG